MLEIGCGTGLNTKIMLTQYGSKIKSYSAGDISDGMINLAKEKVAELKGKFLDTRQFLILQ